ncbi:ComEC/Rec2 family competence protein [Sphingobacterium oryzagri]|uniref:ComEC/Rec2 family competence protein n=1 Tax=Sphingobacterium oryzagri TaxID=3025669 RepID=A0ABY7WH88_9SPHI|nr:ComEC/Rec2 family competence protein [Sphingobacterium sp. KACC 22765]WDF67974.1 ComEC/Rec2 family competence protein [Sphingobacterium sp. KACC 22765]
MVKHYITESVRRVPFARVFFFYALGIVCGFHFFRSVTLLQLSWACLLMLLCCLACLEIFGKTLRRQFFPYLCYAALFLSGACMLGSQLPIARADDIAYSSASVLVGVIVDEPASTEKTLRFPLVLEQGFSGDSSRAVSGTVMVSIAREGQVLDNLAYGDRIVMRNRLTEISEAYNPRQFSYKRYCAQKNIHQQAYLQMDEFQLLDQDNGNKLVAMALDLRKQLKVKFQRVINDPRALDVCAALIFGYRTNFDAETLRTFSETGTIHVLSVSGMHVGIVFYILNFLCRFLDRFRYGAAARFIFIFVAIWAYVMLTGMSPSIMRAGIMISFLLFAKWSNKRYSNLNTLFAAASFQLFCDPFILFDVGFQLSYCAVYGLFTLYPMLVNAITIKQAWLSFSYRFVAVSLSAQLFTTPLALYYFHQFPTYFLLGNMLIAIPATLLMYVGLLLALLPDSSINLFLGACLEWISAAMLAGLHAIQSLPFAVLKGLPLSGGQVGLFATALLGLLVAVQAKWKRALWLAMFAALLFTTLAVKMSIGLDTFRGIKVYNVQRELAVAVIDRNQVSLFSSLDSIDHPRLVNAVWPDLACYSRLEKVNFKKLTSKKETTLGIRTAWGMLLITDRYLPDKISDSVRWVLFRGGRKQDRVELGGLLPANFLILDGSNAIASISRMEETAKYLDLPYYVLKDNFAYVWEKPD